MSKVIILNAAIFVLGIGVGYVVWGEVSVNDSSDWNGTLPNIVYQDKELPSAFTEIAEKYDEGKMTRDTGEVVFSYQLHDLNSDELNEVMICEEDGGVGMDGLVCDIGIYQRNNSGDYTRIYQAMAATLPTISDEVINDYNVLYQDLGFDLDYRCEFEGGLYKCNPQ